MQEPSYQTMSVWNSISNLIIAGQNKICRRQMSLADIELLSVNVIDSRNIDSYKLLNSKSAKMLSPYQHPLNIVQITI